MKDIAVAGVIACALLSPGILFAQSPSTNTTSINLHLKVYLEGALAGTSAGIRSDVRAAIRTRYPGSTTMNTILIQGAEALQQVAFVATSSNTDMAIATSKMVSRASACIARHSSKPAEEVAFLLGKTFNTRERVMAYIRYNGLLDGQVLSTEAIQNPCTGLSTIQRSTSSLRSRISAQSTCPTTKTETDIFFMNGILTTNDEAVNATDEIKEAYKLPLQRLYSNEDFNFRLLYNISMGLLTDLYEVFLQKENDLRVTPEEAFFLWLTVRRIPILPNIVLTPILEQIVATIISNARNTQESVIQRQASRFTATVTGSLDEGRRVLLIAHSQGNLFANQILASILRRHPSYRESIGMIGVATPASRRYTPNNIYPVGYPYWTAHDDRIIRSLSVVATVLPSNVNNDPGSTDQRDLFNHAFLRSYFDDGVTNYGSGVSGHRLASRALIDQAVYRYMSELKFPERELGDGVITARLTWGSNPDVDLHVYEPNGFHVYYSRRTGVSGELDRDDVTSFGPEHYTVPCDSLETGVYRIGVNYFRGRTPEVAQISIRTDDGNIRIFNQRLSIARGTAGNNSPIIVATIKVSREDGQYKYSVQGNTE